MKEQDIQAIRGRFETLIFLERIHDEQMLKDRYLNIWRSVNDIRVQGRTQIKNIQELLADCSEISVPYRSRAWTMRVKK